jgi:hypothetical protein
MKQPPAEEPISLPVAKADGETSQPSGASEPQTPGATVVSAGAVPTARKPWMLVAGGAAALGVVVALVLALRPSAPRWGARHVALSDPTATLSADLTTTLLTAAAARSPSAAPSSLPEDRTGPRVG